VPSPSDSSPQKHATVSLPPDASTPNANHASGALARVGFLRHRTGDCIKNRYEVLEHLGGGNFGSVYRVRDTVVGNILACKEMHVLDDPSTLHDERAAALDLFKREALNLATLRHPHIPAAYFEQEDGAWRICPRCGFDFPAAPVCPDHGAELLKVSSRFYLMMDFVDGPTLEDRVLQSGRPLDEKQALEWVGQIGNALQSLHRIGIVHRDVKPDNIKIRASDNMAMLLDFGLTKKVEEAGSYGTAPLSGTTRFGTVGYAPENLKERESPERRSDIYALGMTLYRVLSGRDPQESFQLKEMRDFSPRYFNKNISPETERLIAVAAAPDLSWRYQNIDDFLADLKAIHSPSGGEYSAPPFTFADGSRARNASDLARLVERKPDESLGYLQNGMFASWLQQNGFAAGAHAAQAALKTHGDNPQRALEIFRRALYPSGSGGVLPHLQIAPGTLHFGALPSGASTQAAMRIHNAGPGLAWGTISIEGADEKNNALPGLQFTPEFQGNDVRFDVTLDTSRTPSGEYSGALLIRTDIEHARVPVSYTVAPLELSIEPPELDFGLVAVGEKFTKEIKIRTPHKYSTPAAGKPRGTVYISQNLQGLSSPERFEGDTVSITVDATAPGMVAREYSGAIQLDTNGGRFRVPVSYVLALSPGRMLMTVLGIAAGVGLGAWALRWLYGLVNADFASAWMIRQNRGGVPSLVDYKFSAGAIILGVLGALFFSQALAQGIENNSRRKKPDPTLRPVMGCLFLFFSAPLGWFATFLLHYVFWGFGDWLLYPLRNGVLASLPQDNAPLAWAALGAFGGLVWGASQALSAIGAHWARYAATVGLSVTFLFLMLNAMLSTGH
jgi:serine/threonine protein kinase